MDERPIKRGAHIQIMYTSLVFILKYSLLGRTLDIHEIKILDLKL